MIDPEELVILDRHWHVSNIGWYTMGFLLFWALGCIASSLTALLLLEWRKQQNKISQHQSTSVNISQHQPTSASRIKGRGWYGRRHVG